MLIKKMIKLIKLIFFINLLFTINLYCQETEFKNWVSKFKIEAIESGISKKVVNEVMLNVKFLPKVIEYDRYQPEFYEDTFTYINKRSSLKRVKQGLQLYKKEKKIIDISSNGYRDKLW